MARMLLFKRAPHFAVVTGLGLVIMVAGAISIALHALAVPFASVQAWAARHTRRIALGAASR